MSSDETLVFAFLWGIAFLLLYRFYNIYKVMKDMKKIQCKCSDVIHRTTYQKNIYAYYYTYIVDNEEYSTSDQSRFKLIFFNPKINDILYLYINEKNPNLLVTPLQVIYKNIYLVLAILLLLLPIIFVII